MVLEIEARACVKDMLYHGAILLTHSPEPFKVTKLGKRSAGVVIADYGVP